VIEKEPKSLRSAAVHLTKHREKFLHQLATRRPILEAQFNAIDRLKYNPSFSDAVESAKRFLEKLP
jgi:hypothetical protein